MLDWPILRKGFRMKSTYDEVQTATRKRCNDMIDSILWYVAEIRKTGVGNDKVSDHLHDLIIDAQRAIALNNRICNNDYPELELTNEHYVRWNHLSRQRRI